MCYELYWLLPSETPIIDNGTTTVIVESLNGTMYVDFIGPDFDSWGDDIIRWAYFPDEKYASYQNELSDVKYYKEETDRLKVDLRNATEKLKNEKELNEHRIDYLEERNEKLKKDVEYYREENEKLKKIVDIWFNKYLDLLGKQKQHNKHQRDAELDLKPKIKREFLDDNCGSIDSDGDEHLTTDDLCELFKPDDARPVGEISIDELRDIFLKVMRESKERERIEEDDGK